jgi:hypothetical protein
MAKAKYTIAKPTALLIGIVVLAFVAVCIVADMLAPGGVNVGERVAGVYEETTQPDLDKCLCEYSSVYEDYVCNDYCGPTAGYVCQSSSDCLQ